MAEKTNGPEGATQQKAQTGGMNKMEAVRRALTEMGQDATPSQMQPYIKQKFGIDMSTDHISTYKGDIRRKAGGAKAKPAMKKAAAPKAASGQQSGAAKSQGAGTSSGKAMQGAGSVSLQDIQTLKGLVGRVGATQLRTLIDLLGR
jgi:hypothetical protein